MKDWTGDILRERFLKFFASKKHKIVASDTLVPADDPTVLFTSAGMNQFKKQFLGHITDFRRAATAQRCLRTDDLELVGKTNCHHTFFEMLGNFSFSDYFKKEAIAFAWEFLTEDLGIDKEKLWASVYRDDEESYSIWNDLIGLRQEKIIKLGDKENFWPAEAKTKGPNGPCGPCSEIFFDWGPETGCGTKVCSPACDCGRFVEVWNLVFTQFDRKPDGTLTPLPNKNIDTGMGLERLASVMQGNLSNFQTDLFSPIIEEIKIHAKQNKQELIFAIADHIRAVTFAIYDGVIPSNEQRGYVVRKLIRKSAFDGRNLGINKPFLYKLVPVVAKVMHKPYPDLEKRRENISQIILSEEKNFSSVLNNAEKLFKDKFQPLASGTAESALKTVPKIVFELYDTHGIPFELSKKLAEARGINISQDEFDKILEEQKALSRSRSQIKEGVFVDLFKYKHPVEVKQLDYNNYDFRARVLGVIPDEKDNNILDVILDKTAFYPESGGQVGDKGTIQKDNNNIYEVIDVKKYGKIIVHSCKPIKGSIKEGNAVKASIDKDKRLSIMRNHTATHLLQAALRKVLGEHIQQQGSLVDVDRLRFDFSHFKDITKPELDRVEEEVNKAILENIEVDVNEMTILQAKKKGALAFFGEKYGDRVRVVSIGDYSKELCAGTHIEGGVAGLGLFRIISEGSISSGIRRIEAVTGGVAYKIMKNDQLVLAGLSQKLNTPVSNINEAVNKLNIAVKELQKKLVALQIRLFTNESDKIVQQAALIKDKKVITYRIDDVDMGSLRRMADILKSKVATAIFALGSVSNGKVFLVLGATDDLIKQGIDARKFIQELAPIIGGSGGGRPDFVQAGGDNPANLDTALARLKEII